jgi:hypothetical protein
VICFSVDNSLCRDRNQGIDGCLLDSIVHIGGKYWFVFWKPNSAWRLGVVFDIPSLRLCGNVCKGIEGCRDDSLLRKKKKVEKDEGGEPQRPSLHIVDKGSDLFVTRVVADGPNSAHDSLSVLLSRQNFFPPWYTRIPFATHCDTEYHKSFDGSICSALGGMTFRTNRRQAIFALYIEGAVFPLEKSLSFLCDCTQWNSTGETCESDWPSEQQSFRRQNMEPAEKRIWRDHGIRPHNIFASDLRGEQEKPFYNTHMLYVAMDRVYDERDWRTQLNRMCVSYLDGQENDFHSTHITLKEYISFSIYTIRKAYVQCL